MNFRYRKLKKSTLCNMIAIKKLSFKTDLFSEKEVVFTKGINLIYSDGNSLGKTTLIRILLNAIGFNLPLTKGLENQYLTYVVVLDNFEGKEIRVERKQNGKVYINSEEINVELPDLNSNRSVIRAVFGVSDAEIIENLLGAFYIDQETGWNVVNRGRILGNSFFHIDKLLIALSRKSAKDIDERLTDIKEELARYKQLLSVSESAVEVGRYEGGVELENAEKMLRNRLFEIRVRRKFCKDQVDSLEVAVRDNQYVKDVVEQFNIIVKSESGEEVKVTKNNIVGLNANDKLLQTRLEILRQELDSYDSEARKIKRELYIRYSSNPGASWLEYYMEKIRNIDVRQQTIESIIKYLNDEGKALRKRKQSLLDVDVIHKMSTLMIGYLDRLNVKFSYVNKQSSILTRRFAIHSGAERSKRVLAFKLSYIKIFEELLNVRLPIVVDSPYSKETDESNFQLFMQLLKEDFSEHQIIIASIRDDILEGHQKISLVGGLLDGEPSCEYVKARTQDAR